jgi:60 kDa SS-A/Ro ribonucleoprotein
MARFNKKSSLTQTEISHTGDIAFKMVPEMELYSLVCSSILTPTYYVPNTNDQLNRIKARIREVDPLYVAQLAIYVREKMHLRTIPLVLTVELAKIHSGDNLLRKLTKRVVQRADEITELVSYYTKANKHVPKFIEAKAGHRVEKKIYKFSNQIKKGIADIFESGKFNEYSYAKYSRDTEVKLRDVLFLTHPKPNTTDMKELFFKIANNKLSTPYTWETELSKAGQEGLSKKKVWEDLILSGKMGYMATLRNMRNFLKEGVSDILLQKVADRISDPEEVRKSKQLPFRFLSAYRVLIGGPQMGWCTEDKDTDIIFENTKILVDALEKAVLVSVENMPVFENENVLIATDVSSSMWTPISSISKVMRYDIGALLAMLAQNRCTYATVGMFGDDWKILNDLANKDILWATNEIYKREGEVGYSTNGWKVIEGAINDFHNEGVSYDRIMMFTDVQMWNSRGIERGKINRLWKEYKRIVPNAKLYLFDLGGYGQVPIDIKKGDVYLIAGWSDSIFTVLTSIEKGNDVLNEVKQIEL